MAEMKLRNLREESNNTITLTREDGTQYSLTAGKDMNSLILNGKEVETIEEAKIAMNIMLKTMSSMVGGY